MKDLILILMMWIIGVFVGYFIGKTIYEKEGDYLIQSEKMVVMDTGRIYYKVMIYHKDEKPIYTECDTEERVEELKAYYEGDK